MQLEHKKQQWKSNYKYFIIAAVLGIFALTIISGLAQKESYDRGLTQKIKEHNEQIKKEKDEMQKDLKDKKDDLEKQMWPLMSTKDDLRISVEETMEYNRADRKSRTEKAEEKERKKHKYVFNKLIKGEDVDFNSTYFYDAFDCYGDIKDKVFRFRNTIIAKNNLSEKYKKDVERIESLKEIDNWNRATLEKKKAYIKNAEKYDVNASDEELARILIEEMKDGYLLRCLEKAKRGIPILTKYRADWDLLSYMDILKRTAEFFGIAKEIDWTVPIMIKKEIEGGKRKRSKSFSLLNSNLSNIEKGCEEDISTLSPPWLKPKECALIKKIDQIYEDVQKDQSIKDKYCGFKEKMDQEYLKLKGNPGLQYKIFTKYRNSLNEGCLESGIYPKNNAIPALKAKQAKLWTVNQYDEKIKHLNKEMSEMRKAHNGSWEAVQEGPKKFFENKKSEAVRKRNLRKKIDQQLAAELKRSREELSVKWD